VKYIAKYKRPVLIVHGDKDPIVPVDYSRQAIKFYKDARLHVIPGAGHGFRPKEFEEAMEQIRQFLN
jgi:dipeptidyl aminopeptidase/acylaminoacyl peptidase